MASKKNKTISFCSNISKGAPRHGGFKPSYLHMGKSNDTITTAYRSKNFYSESEFGSDKDGSQFFKNVFSSMSSIKKNASRDFRIRSTLEEWIEPSDYEYDIHDTHIAVNAANLENSMLCITMSTVMMMACKAQDIPDEYFTWTETYLNCIKDERGSTPPNIQGILNHISYLQTGEYGKAAEQNGSEKDESDGGGSNTNDSKNTDNKSTEDSISNKGSVASNNTNNSTGMTRKESSHVKFIAIDD